MPKAKLQEQTSIAFENSLTDNERLDLIEAFEKTRGLDIPGINVKQFEEDHTEFSAITFGIVD